MNIDIKAALSDDVNTILKIENACFSNPWSEGSIRESFENPDSRFYLAFCEGEPAGYLGVQVFSGEGNMLNVATLPEFRRQGVAKALINKALENEMEFLTLEVRESNEAAIALYTSLGFVKVGARPDYYSNPTETAILMTKTIKEIK
ncbi:MAG: ribosomal protein S18-alanine N-acetyltransferase [Eubacterium sp.]|nr:ribosomal protein S18-alanine N-acetyltransferase [Eubacterium sp.]